MKEGQPRQAIQRADYRPYPWRLQAVALHFSIHDSHTEVRATLTLEARDGGAGPLELQGSDLSLQSLAIDGRALDAQDYALDGETLTVPEVPARCELQTVVHIQPSANLALEGLYQSGEFLLTQCEPEGFRKIDRPASPH